MAAYVLPPPAIEDQQRAGEKIIHLSKMASSNEAAKAADEDWTKFISDPGKYLFELGYRYAKRKPDGTLEAGTAFPPNLIHPIFEQEHAWYLAIPNISDIDETYKPPNETPYGQDLNVFLCRYLMRHCR